MRLSLSSTTRGVSRSSFIGGSLASIAGLALLSKGLVPAANGEQTVPGKKPLPWQDLDKLLDSLEPNVEQFLWIPRSDGRLLNLLVRLTRSKNALEIGTSLGFGTLWLCAALAETGGHLTTLEILGERVEAAKSNLKKAGLAAQADCREGDAHQMVPALKGPFDFVLLDADKSGHADYFKKLFPQKLAPHAVVVSNNALQPREGMKTYLDLVMKNPEFDSVIVSTTQEDGYCISVRKGA